MCERTFRCENPDVRNKTSEKILDSQVKQLRRKEIRTMKVLWEEATQEMTWVVEDLMKKSYPYLFLGKSYFRGRKFLRWGECKTREFN